MVNAGRRDNRKKSEVLIRPCFVYLKKSAMLKETEESQEAKSVMEDGCQSISVCNLFLFGVQQNRNFYESV